MENEQLQDFNERLGQWMANQGFWFQLRHSMSGSGVKGRTMFHLLRLGSRLLVFLLLVSLGIWIYLMKRTSSTSFTTDLRNDLKGGLSASQLEMGFVHSRGQFEIAKLAAEGGNQTFFTTLEARNVRGKMGLLDGLVGIWQPGVISLSRLDIELRAGADDADSARKFAEALFARSENVEIHAFDVADATLRWGFSEKTRGAIESSTMRAQRTLKGWRLGFKGGTFSQNWLRGLDVVNLVVNCEPDGLVFEKVELRKGGGSVDFTGLRVSGGERPELRGIAKIRNLSLDEILPPAARSFIEGTISGDFQVSGSTNSSDGVCFAGEVVLDGGNVVALRERIHLLKALSVVDYSRNYHRIDFREGSFRIKTGGGGMKLTDVKLKAGDLFTLEGNMTVRPPTDKEVEEAVARGEGMNDAPLPDGLAGSPAARDVPESPAAMSLKRDALEARRIRDGQQSPDSLTLFDRLGLSLQMRQMQNQAADRLSRMLRYEGMFRITIPGDAFERGAALHQAYPVDAATGRIPMEVPIDGYLYDLTLKQTEDIYLKGKR